jgi:hypothetical protein
MTRVSVFISVCIILNVVGSSFASFLNGLLFLDTIGTAAGALALGPWWGAIIGGVSGWLIALEPCKQQFHNYTIVNVICGLFWGVVGRTVLNLFAATDNYRKLFVNIIIVGAAGGLVASTISLFITFKFAWRIADVDPETFRFQWHLTVEYYRWLLESGILDRAGSLLQILGRDIIGILPDKITSIALAVYIIYYAAPSFAPLATKTDTRDLYPASAGFWLFGICITALIWGFVSSGHVNVNPQTCTVMSRDYISSETALWVAPLVLWLLALLPVILKSRRPLWRDRVEDAISARGNHVKLVYRDVLAILAGAFAVLLVLSQKRQAGGVASVSPATEIAQLMSEGFGILAFFAVFAFLPGFLLRVFDLDPDLNDDDELNPSPF